MAIGTSTQVLTVTGGIPAWAAAGIPTFSNGVTTSDLTTGSSLTVTEDTSTTFPNFIIPTGFTVTTNAITSGTNPGMLITMGKFVFQSGSTYVGNGDFLAL